MKHLLLRLRPTRPLVLPIVCSLVFVGQIESAIAITISNIYAFGDSSTDTGNAPHDPPYWNGRHSNGPIWIDYLAAEFGLSMSPSNSGGNNYAFGGAFSNDVLTVQLPQFSAAHGGVADPNALYAINAGSVDLISGLNPVTAAHRVQQVVRDLSSLGAQLFVVANMVDFAQRPAYLNIAYAHQVTVAFNDTLASDLASLTGVTIFFADAFEQGNRVVANPDEYGFADVTHACLSSSTPCSTPDTFLWWDYVGHPTTEGHRVINMSVLSAIPMPGDYNKDLVVNDQDYDAWRSAFGSTVNRYLSADGNGDGVVDAADYTVWRDNVGAIAPGIVAANSGRAAFSIPEPTSTLAILVAGVLVCVWKTRLRAEHVC